jgi:hypothetical protein
MADAPRHPHPAQPTRGELPPQTQRMLQTRIQALRLGATCCAVLGGVACYTLLVHLGLASLLAGIIGLIFALLGRMALLSLAIDWLQAAARRSAAAGSAPGSAPGRAHETPDMGGTRSKGPVSRR